MVLIKNIPIEINNHDVFRLLGHVKNQDKKLSDRFMRLYIGEKHSARELMNPRAVFVVKDVDSVPEREVFLGAEKVVFSLTTIGPKLEDRVTKLSTIGELEHSVVLDAIGSSAVESAANFVNKRINHGAEAMGYDYTCRFSPGYCSWSIGDQKLFFDFLPVAQIGVKLTNSMMMIPRKSVTFAINFGAKESLDMGLGVRDCSSCNKKDCKYRKQMLENKFDTQVSRKLGD